MNMPAEGVFHNLVIVSIRKRYPGQARKVMSALWGMGLMMLAKTIVVVSEHVNVHDLSEVAWRATGNIDPAARPDDPRGADGRSRSRRAPPPLRRQARRGRHGEGPARRRRPGVARRDRDERRGARARHAGAGRTTGSEQARGTCSTRSSSSTPSSPCPSPTSPWCSPPAAGRAGGRCGWVTAAMVGARTCAMAANRVIDRWIDARNPAHGRPPPAARRAGRGRAAGAGRPPARC